MRVDVKQNESRIRRVVQSPYSSVVGGFMGAMLLRYSKVSYI